MMKTNKIITIDIIDSDNDGDIIVGYRQHVLHNNKLVHSDTDNDIPYHIHDLVRLTHLQQQAGLQATIINGSRYPTNHNLKCTDKKGHLNALNSELDSLRTMMCILHLTTSISIMFLNIKLVLSN